MGLVTNDLASPGLIGGLVLIVMLIGFTIMQNAFSGGGALRALRRRRRAAGAGDDRLRRRDLRLERRPPTRSTSAARSRANSASSAARSRGRRRPGSTCCIRSIATATSAALDGLLHAALRPHPSRYPAARRRRPLFLVPAEGAPGGRRRGRSRARHRRASRTSPRARAAEERILHDAIHDNLTGLPNRELFFDRLETALIAARRPGAPRPVRGRDRHRPAASDQRRASACRSAIPRC